MHHGTRHPARAHALRLDLPAVLHAAIAATISMSITWLIQTVTL